MLLTDNTTIVSIVLPVCVSIVGGALAMAWRLGGLERTVKDLVTGQNDMNHKIEVIDTKTDAAINSATAAISAVSAITGNRDPASRTRRSDTTENLTK